MIRILLAGLIVFVAGQVEAKFYGTRSVCSAVVEHQPVAGVNYYSGMSEQGVGDALIDDVVKIPISLDLVESFGLDSGLELKPDVAVIEVYMDGRISYNDQDVSAKIGYVCGELVSFIHDPDVIEGEEEVLDRKQVIDE